jgi:hypothetical protein
MSIRDNTSETFKTGDAGAMVQAQAYGRMIDEVGDGMAAILPRFDGQLASVKAAEAVLPPAESFLAPDLALIAANHNGSSRFGWNSFLQDSFSEDTRKQTDATMKTGSEGGGEAQFVSNVVQGNYGRFSGRNTQA